MVTDVPKEHQSWSKRGSGAKRPDKDEKETESSLFLAPVNYIRSASLLIKMTLKKHYINTAKKSLIATALAVNNKISQKDISNWKLKIEDFILSILKIIQLWLSVGEVG